ncbi:MAG: pilus assembly protein PilM [Desulfobacterales bacterium]|nr:pilus assembly protein PilM [Desulfobacterales bacterium]MDX2510892.1 pilus assembly protein PilM [Desulfobacterales bacterium]
MLNQKDIYPIGIDITDQNIYAAQFQKTRQGMVVGHLYNHPLDTRPDADESPEALIQALKVIAKSKRFKGRLINIHLPERYLNFILTTLDLGADETITDAIARECRRSLSFPLEEAVVDYASLFESKEKKKRYKAAIVAVRKDVIDTYLALTRRAGLSVGVVDLHLSSLLRLHRFLFTLGDAPVILCQVDDTQSLLSVVNRHRILAQRHIPWGRKPIVNHLISKLELSDTNGQAASMLAHYGLMHERMSGASGKAPKTKIADRDTDVAIYRTLFQLLTPFVEELIHELYQITGYVRSETDATQFEAIVLYGWASAINNLDQYVENRLNIPTRTVNPMTKLTWRVDTPELERIDGAPFGPALGLALRKASWL